MTQSASYQAPFRPGGESPVDAELARKLLTIALSRGGEYADLFFEYQAGGAISFEEGITRSASRGVSMGLGVRVQKGDATGYAHVEDLSWEAMKRAAETAARIAQGGKTIAPLAIERMAIPSRYELDRVSIDLPGVDKRSLLERASRAAMAHDSRIIKAEASFVEEVREILIATSDGRLVHDVQPLLRFGIRAIAEKDGRRESGRSGGGGRMTLGYFDGLSPEWHAEQAAKQALILLDARPAPRRPDGGDFGPR
ncbi:MAG: DNA gyrase modulator [Pseudomonadota bacterium]